MKKNYISAHNFGYGVGATYSQDSPITKLELRSKQDLKDYLIDIIEINEISHSSKHFVTDNILLIPHLMIVISSAS